MINLKRENKIKNAYLQLIKDICEDYDGYEDADNLKNIINEIKKYAIYALNNDDSQTIYISGNQNESISYNILMEGIEQKTFILKRTCDFCPEQYDVYLDGRIVGYLRARHGFFYCRYYSDLDEEIVYFSNIKGDGCLEDNERDFHLKEAISAIAHKENIVNYLYITSINNKE